MNADGIRGWVVGIVSCDEDEEEDEKGAKNEFAMVGSAWDRGLEPGCWKLHNFILRELYGIDRYMAWK